VRPHGHHGKAWRCGVRSPIGRKIVNSNSLYWDVRFDIDTHGHETHGLEVRVCIHESFERCERERRRSEDREKAPWRPSTPITASTFTVERRVCRAGDPPDTH
jgi:hypothetical protein